MSKHETSNQFNQGLMMDIHPLQMPNTALTDCLNGTFITYNGNEHVLQNDMGNFKLEKCKLSENYIPIGTASYGDILYIASYNPIDKKFELGSYPSPLQWNALNEESILALPSIISDYINSKEDVLNISWLDISSYSKKIIFDDSSFKMCPGDNYMLQTEGNNSYIMENLKFSILDENLVKHSISPEKDKKTPVSWEIPGFLCVENSVMTPFEHKLTLKSAVVGNNSVTYNISSILTVQDDNLCKILDTYKNNFVYEITTNISNEKIIISAENLENENSESTNLKYKCTSDVYPWLNEKKQLISEYTITLTYEGDYALTEQKDGKNIFNIVETKFTVLPKFSDNGGVFIIYDNLQQSLTYTTNGQNVPSAATQYFTWQRFENDDTENGSYWTIEFDYFMPNEDDEITCFYGDFFSNALYESEFNSEGIGFNVPTTGWDNKLLYVEIRIKSKSGNKNIGRFAFLDARENDTVIKYTPATRMDILYNIQDVYDSVCKNNCPTNGTIKSVEKNTSLQFDHDEFNITNLNKSTIWLDDRFDQDKITCNQTWKCEITANPLSKSNVGIWVDLNFSTRISNDANNYIANPRFIYKKEKQYDVIQEFKSAKCYIPGTFTKINWKNRELAWDQDRGYDAYMKIHNLDNGVKGELGQWFDRDAFDKGTSYDLWEKWLPNNKDFLFKSIYAYKYANLGNHYHITGIGYAASSGRAGIDGYHINGHVYGSPSIPEIIMTKDDNVGSFLFYFTPDSTNKLEYWKRRYLYKLREVDRPEEGSLEKVYVSIIGNADPSNLTLSWLFNTNPDKLVQYKNDVEFDPLSRMEWLIPKYTLSTKLDINFFEFPNMDILTWNDVYEDVIRDLNNPRLKYVYDRMTSICDTSEAYQIPTNCLQWCHEGDDLPYTLTDFLPQCCVYENGGIAFNADLARRLGVKYSREDSYFQFIYGGNVRTNIGPLKIIKYGF